MKMKPLKPPNQETYKRRWSDEVAKMGYLMKPVCLIQCLKDLDLTSQEAVMLDYLFSYWYDYTDHNNVYPATATIADHLGLGNSTVATQIRRLEKKGYLKRVPRIGNTNIYELKYTVIKIREHVLKTHPLQKRRGHSSKLGTQPPPDLNSKEETLTRTPKQNNLTRLSNIINEMYK